MVVVGVSDGWGNGGQMAGVRVVGWQGLSDGWGWGGRMAGVGVVGWLGSGWSDG